MQTVNVGFVGTRRITLFNETEAQQQITEAFYAVTKRHPNARITLSLGRSSIEAASIASTEATNRGWRIERLTCGDESPSFVALAHELIRVGPYSDDS